MLAYLDEEFARGSIALKHKPSEYWQRNFYVTPSAPRDYEVARRDRIGIDRWMFGTDYPHPEGTWQNTLDWIRTAFAGAPECDARRMLGENAVACYGLDRDALERIAERVGPSVEDILGSMQPVRPGIIADFDKGAGYASPMEQFDTTELGRLLHTDVSQTVATSRA